MASYSESPGVTISYDALAVVQTVGIYASIAAPHALIKANDGKRRAECAQATRSALALALFVGAALSLLTRSIRPVIVSALTSLCLTAGAGYLIRWEA